MPELLRYSILAFIVFVTHFQEAITGFGCTVLALPFVIFLLSDVEVAKIVLVIQAWILTGYIVIVARKDIVWRQYGRIVLCAGMGLPVGIYIAEHLPQESLKYILGAFMVGVGARGLIIQIRNHQFGKWSPNLFTNCLMNGVLILGGLMHGAFGSGGPFVVIYATRALPNKSLFRVTLCMLWFTLNSTLIAKWTFSQVITPQIWVYTAICTPFTILGMVAGDRWHHRINEHAFRVMVFAVLLLSGIAMLYATAARMG